MAFSVASSMPRTKAAHMASGRRRRLRPSIASDGRVVVQMAPFGKLRWDEAFEMRRLVSSYFVHRGLTTKDRLFHAVGHIPAEAAESAVLMATVAPPAAHLGASRPSPAFAGGISHAWGADQLVAMGMSRGWSIVARAPGRDAAALCRPAVEDWLASGEMEGATAVVVKHARANNAMAVRLCPATAEAVVGTLVALCGPSDDGAPPPGAATAGDSWLLQRCFDRPLLLGAGPAAGAAAEAPVKMTLRVNVLAVGRAAVFVHDEALVHCASRPWAPGGWGDAAVHISNNSLQRSLPGYDAARHTLTLDELSEREATGRLALWTHGDDGRCRPADGLLAASRGRASLGEAVRGRVLEAVAALFARAAGPGMGREWMPQAGCAETFGLDLLPEVEGGRLALRLLEVNEGPALGALARPDACDRVVEDMWRLLVDPWLHAARELGAASTAGRASSEGLQRDASACGEVPAGDAARAGAASGATAGGENSGATAGERAARESASGERSGPAAREAGADSGSPRAGGGAQASPSESPGDKCAWAEAVLEGLRYGDRAAGTRWRLALSLRDKREAKPRYLPPRFIEHAAAKLSSE